MIPYEVNKVIFDKTLDCGFTTFRWILPTYTLMMGIGILVGYYLLHKRIKHIALFIRIRMFLIVTFSTMVGGRLFYLIFYQTPDPWYWLFIEMFTIWRTGSVSFGGLSFLLMSLFLVCKWYKIDFIKFLDDIAPSLAIGLFLARLGCFFAGCCHGTTTDVPWAIIRHDVGIHPTPLYSSTYNLIIFVIVYWLSKKKLDRGIVFSAYLVLYGIARFLVEMIRVNPKYLGISLQQYFSLIVILIGSWFILKKFNKDKCLGIHKSKKKGVR